MPVVVDILCWQRPVSFWVWIKVSLILEGKLLPRPQSSMIGPSQSKELKFIVVSKSQWWVREVTQNDQGWPSAELWEEVEITSYRKRQSLVRRSSFAPVFLIDVFM